MIAGRSYQRLTGEEKGCALLISASAVFYFTGFRTSARRPKQVGYTAVWLTEQGTGLIYPESWEMQIEEMNLQGIDEKISYKGSVSQFQNVILSLIKRDRPQSLWMEYEAIPLPLYLSVCAAAGSVARMDVTEKLWAMRLIKSPDEIQALRRAAPVAMEAMEHAKKILRPGMKETEVVAEVEYHMRKAGSWGMPFAMKAMTGARSAVVTRVPQEYPIQPGDLFLMDFGAVVDGYSSDWTRTFCVGEPSKEQQELYDFVWEIERSCICQIRPGVSLSSLVKQMEEMAAGHPLGKFLKTHLGHSVGITSHEPPVIEPGVLGTLEPGMVITIEPGAYIPGLGGVRIEDEILVTESGDEILTGLKEEGLAVNGEKNEERRGMEK